MPLPLKLIADLAMQRLLVAFYRQEEVGPLLLELSKNGCLVCNASAWINTEVDWFFWTGPIVNL